MRLDSEFQPLATQTPWVTRQGSELAAAAVAGVCSASLREALEWCWSAPPIAASALEGRQTTRGRIVSVYRPLNHLGLHRGRVESGSEIYFPNPLGAGEQICLTDVAAGSGAVLGH